ncbi:HlyD family efflux transporter periplasmic adaptor subunit, partial [bacterium]|nr:HlyD family efflux transporter periplasmic adaptor subunit [bacterium]
MKKLPVIVLLIVTASLVLTACSAKTNEESTPAPVSTQNQTLIAEGSLQPINSLVHSFSVSGQIEEVLVKNGDMVKAGQALARLKDSPAAKLALENAQAEALAAQQAYDQLLSSKDLTLAQAQLAVANAKKDFDKVSANQVVQGQARQTNQDVINAARAAVTLAQDKVKTAEEKYNDYPETPDSDPLKAAALSTLSNARLNLEQAKLNLNNYINPPNAQDLSISNAEVALAKAKYEDAQRQLEKLQNGANSNELDMAKARLDSANSAVVNAQNQIDALTLTANIAGTIVDLTLQPGQKVAAGETAVVIADYSNWVVKTDNLTETEVTTITTGQKANVILDALPEKTLQGEVTYINSL